MERTLRQLDDVNKLDSRFRGNDEQREQEIEGTPLPHQVDGYPVR